MPKRLFVALIAICACSVTADEPPKRLIFQGQDEVATENQIRTIQSVRVAEPPVLDGKLDDACWDAARGISGFTDILGQVAERAPLKRNVELEEVAGTSVFLASNLSSGITGEVIYVDCGYNIVGI